MNTLYLLENHSHLSPDAAALVGAAGKELTRVSRIVRQSLSYYRVGSIAKELDLSAVVEDSLQIFADKLQLAGIELARSTMSEARIMGYPDEVRQVVDNLLLNAIEATPQGGRLRVALHRSRDWKDHNKPGFRLTIADTGHGIPRECMDRIFEPFYTTKAEKGTGLGLWVVRGIVAKHDGSIGLRSSDAAGRSGTVVSVLWPIAVQGQRTGMLVRSESAG